MPCSFSLMIFWITSLFLTPSHKNCYQARGCTLKLDTQSAHFWPPTQLLSRAKSQAFEFFQAPGLLLASIFALWSYPPQSQSCAAAALISTDGFRVPQTKMMQSPVASLLDDFLTSSTASQLPIPGTLACILYWEACSCLRDTAWNVPASGTPPAVLLPCCGPLFPCFLP